MRLALAGGVSGILLGDIPFHDARSHTAAFVKWQNYRNGESEAKEKVGAGEVGLQLWEGT